MLQNDSHSSKHFTRSCISESSHCACNFAHSLENLMSFYAPKHDCTSGRLSVVSSLEEGCGNLSRLISGSAANEQLDESM